MQRLVSFFHFLSFFIIFNSIAYANDTFAQRQSVQRFIDQMVKQYHFNKQELTEVMQQVQLQPQVIESMEKPYEKKTWDFYKQLFLTTERLAGGIAFWQANQNSLAKAEKKYGVPANIIVAILGIETLYGQRQGEYRVLDALATLAFNYPKRADFFTKELREFLLLCREHHVSPTKYYGSYAGAMGKPQFMPSSYRYYAADFTNNPRKDLMHDDEAVIASVANYLHQHGWQMNQGVAQPVTITNNHYKKIDTSYKTANYQLQQLLAAGIKPSATTHSNTKVGLIELITQTNSEFWLTYPNFYVITHYNSSPQYAMAVYLLSQQLKNQWALKEGTKYS